MDPDHPDRPAVVQLQQVTRRTFVLQSSLAYTGQTGVLSLPDAARVVRPEDLGPHGLTDLASVPSALRWFVSTYDVHTPAALVHDRLIGDQTGLGVSEIDADRFFRFMLKELGVRLVRRWMMWTAVTFGTRWRTKRLRVPLILWAVLAATGMTAFTVAVVTHNPGLLMVAAVAPLPVSLLWGRQWGAGLVASVTAIWVFPPTILGALGFAFYWMLEHAVSILPIDRQVKGDEPVAYRNF